MTCAVHDQRSWVRASIGSNLGCVVSLLLSKLYLNQKYIFQMPQIGLLTWFSNHEAERADEDTEAIHTVSYTCLENTTSNASKVA